MISQKKNPSGFTVIEVVLVLAITGLMFIMVILGTQGSIDNQRYSDSVYSFKDFLQNQYNEVLKTSLESRPAGKDNACDANKDARGRSSCFVLGRLIEFQTSYGISDYSDVIKTHDIIGKEPPEQKYTNDTDYFKLASLRIDASTATDYNLEWGAKVSTPSRKASADVIMIIRSPVSGSIRTYALATIPSGYNKITYLLDNSNDSLNKQSEFCVHPEGISFSNRRAVVIRANGSNSSAVEIAPLDGIVNGVAAIKC